MRYHLKILLLTLCLLTSCESAETLETTAPPTVSDTAVYDSAVPDTPVSLADVPGAALSAPSFTGGTRELSDAAYADYLEALESLRAAYDALRESFRSEDNRALLDAEETAFEDYIERRRDLCFAAYYALGEDCEAPMYGSNVVYQIYIELADLCSERTELLGEILAAGEL